MIDYEPDYWQLRFIFRCRGSVFPKGLVWAVPSTLLALILHVWVINRDEDLDTAAFRNFYFALSFMLVFRSQLAYSRYWEAGTIILRVRGNWFNAVSACFAFCNSDPAKTKDVQNFKHALVRLVSLLFCSSLQQVAVCENEEFEIIDISGFSQESIEYLAHAPEKALVVLQWIQQLIMRNVHQSVVNAPAPIVSRAFQELSNGIVDMVDAQKISDIPFPFPWAQMLSTMMILTSLITPFVLATTTSSLAWCVLLNFVSVMSLSAIHYVAAELEMPFGDDLNDLPLRALQESLNTALIQLLDDHMSICPTYNLTESSYECRTEPCTLGEGGDDYKIVTPGPVERHTKARAKARKSLAKTIGVQGELRTILLCDKELGEDLPPRPGVEPEEKLGSSDRGGRGRSGDVQSSRYFEAPPEVRVAVMPPDPGKVAELASNPISPSTVGRTVRFEGCDVMQNGMSNRSQRLEGGDALQNNSPKQESLRAAQGVWQSSFWNVSTRC
eukprot:TRINITY_DN29088_c0_g1_i1.p1 TRINITY_DN29088_c0_g1~~TRINITY_DN29088_c0_g1_i1.p1  ORF type:complete len:499 (+),score=76.22 TRINITY_DN29088_c0_g1_i1:63-1559(+)